MGNGRVLAIDYGQKSIGLAVSDEARTMAFGRGVLKNQVGEDGLKIVLEKLLKQCQEDQIKLIIIGLPLGQNQEDTAQTKKIREFAGNLKEFLQKFGLSLPIEFIDESFSSYEANKILFELGVPSQDRKKTEDEMAAIVLIHRLIDFRP